jgi:hypothetical protein
MAHAKVILLIQKDRAKWHVALFYCILLISSNNVIELYLRPPVSGLHWI